MSSAENDEGMTFWEHLEELRQRLFKMAVAASLGGGLAWFFKGKLLSWLTTPFKEAWVRHFSVEPAIYYPDPAGMFIAYLKLCFLGGLVLAMPIIFYQMWAFIAPGLYAQEKRFAIPFVVASTLLFAGGVYFGMTLAFPTAFAYLLSFTNEPIEGLKIVPNIMIGEYVSFITRMIIAFGVVFELPVVVFFLSVAGIVNHRHLIKFARYFVVLSFVLGALLTPPDMLSQFLLAGPLCALYVVSIGIAWAFGKKETLLG